MATSHSKEHMLDLLANSPCIVVLYHADCLDGWTAAWVVWKKYPQATFIPVRYQEEPPVEVDGADVIIVDFSYPPEVMEDIAASARSLLVIDHHKSANLNTGGYGIPDQLVFDLEHSGAMLTWNYFNAGYEDALAPDLIRYVQDRDLWRFELPNTREYIEGLSSLPRDNFAVWEMDVGALGKAGLIYQGGILLVAKTKEVAKYLENAFDFHLDEFVVPACNCPSWLASDVGHVLIENSSGLSAAFSLTYFDTSLGTKFSLRSTDEGEDVSLIAKRFGGGGHRNAAGFFIESGYNSELYSDDFARAQEYPGDYLP